MKEITLSQGKVALVDDEDYEYLNQFKWCAVKSGLNYYAARTKEDRKARCKTIKMHRVIMRTPNHLQVDHIDHDGLNNQKSNLRNCTGMQNTMNKNVSTKVQSKYKGVTYNFSIVKGKKYEYIRARIMIEKRYLNIGNFKTEEAAALAYDSKAKELFGEFANLNFKEAI